MEEVMEKEMMSAFLKVLRGGDVKERKGACAAGA